VNITTLTMPDWLELANDAFYLIGSAVFQCVEYHYTTKVRQKSFCFSYIKVLARLTRLIRLTWTLRPWLATYPTRDSNSEPCQPIPCHVQHDPVHQNISYNRQQGNGLKISPHKRLVTYFRYIFIAPDVFPRSFINHCYWLLWLTRSMGSAHSTMLKVANHTVFIFRLFNDNVSSSYYTASNDGMNNE
jgi:hypothetical protein